VIREGYKTYDNQCKTSRRSRAGSAARRERTQEGRHRHSRHGEREASGRDGRFAVGTGKLDDNGKKIEFNVKVGDKVLISKYGGTEIKIDGENYLIMREDNILGIIG
jgi:co-chaperonin GroES (HSP10)